MTIIFQIILTYFGLKWLLINPIQYFSIMYSGMLLFYYFCYLYIKHWNNDYLTLNKVEKEIDSLNKEIYYITRNNKFKETLQRSSIEEKFNFIDFVKI